MRRDIPDSAKCRSQPWSQPSTTDAAGRRVWIVGRGCIVCSSWLSAGVDGRSSICSSVAVALHVHTLRNYSNAACAADGWWCSALTVGWRATFDIWLFSTKQCGVGIAANQNFISSLGSDSQEQILTNFRPSVEAIFNQFHNPWQI